MNRVLQYFRDVQRVPDQPVIWKPVEYPPHLEPRSPPRSLNGNVPCSEAGLYQSCVLADVWSPSLG